MAVESSGEVIRHWKILRGDNVMIIRGKDKGETGRIKRVIRSQNGVIVEAGPKDTPIELVLEQTYNEKAGIGMPDL